MSEDNKDIQLDGNGIARKPNGKFVKGLSGNPKGRPKKIKPEQIMKAAEVDSSIDPSIFGTSAKQALEYLLSTAKNRTEVKQLATVLAPYQTPKKASVETTIKDFSRIEFRMIAPETMVELQDIYKKEPKLVEQLTADDMDKITQGDVINIDKVIEVEVESE